VCADALAAFEADTALSGSSAAGAGTHDVDAAAHRAAAAAAAASRSAAGGSSGVASGGFSGSGGGGGASGSGAMFSDADLSDDAAMRQVRTSAQGCTTLHIRALRALSFTVAMELPR